MSMSEAYRLFYASDIHGSEKCFLKFINAGKFYKADALVMGGDITGKMIVPLIRREGKHHARFLGRDFVAETEEEAKDIEKTIRMNGFYPIRMEPDEHQALQENEPARQKMIDRLVLQSVERWIDIAETRLAGTGIRCFINAGNDDEDYVDEALKRSSIVENHEGGLVDLNGDLQMIVCGYSNRTPFDSPRELDEPELETYINNIIGKVRDPKNAIFTLHVPPFNSGLDSAPMLKDGGIVTKGGHTVMAPVGSTAVRRVIEQAQPVLALHGHVHESRATKTIGRTLCINPGSEYSEGVLRGALINFKRNKIQGHQLVQA
jgi:Icc-related predicted phosphoesterase